MTLLDLFWVFFRIGLFTFGGGYAMLPMIQAEVSARGWMTSEALVNFIAVSESTPGPFAVNISTYVGMERAGIPGAICATLGVALPSFIVILIVARCFERFRKNRVVAGCLYGMRCAVVGLIASALISVGGTVFFPGGISTAAFSGAALWSSLVIFAGMAYLAFKKCHPIVIILVSAALGMDAGYLLGL